MSDYKVTMAGQDITSTVQFYSDEGTGIHSRVNSTPNGAGGGASPQPIIIHDTLGQGAGTGAGHSGRTSQLTFFTTLGPAATAIGAGQTVTSPQLVRQSEVIVTSPNGVRLFGGYAGKMADATIGTRVYTQVECYDYWQALTRVTINEILDGISDVAAIKYLLTTYAPWIDQSQIPAFASGTLLGRVWRNKTLQWGIQKIADMTGRQVYVNAQKQLIYVSPTQAALAPFALSDQPDFRSTFPHTVDSYETDDTSIINRVTLFGGRKPTPDFNQDISTQANGTNTTFMLAYYPRKSTSGKVVVTVNGQVLTLGYALGTGSANVLTSNGGSADVLLDANARTLTFATAPAAGATVICTYRYEQPLIIQLTDQKSYAYYGNWYDGVISDETVVDSATAIQRCRVVLLEQAYGQTSIKARCYQAGLFAGMQLKLTNAIKGINNTYIIQEVTATPLGPGVFEYNLTLGAWNWNLVDVLMQLAQRTQGSDLNQQETVTPTQVQINNTINVSLGAVVKASTRAMAKYSPGLGVAVTSTVAASLPYTLPTIVANTTGSMFPGLFSI